MCVAGLFGDYVSGCSACEGDEYCPENSLQPGTCPEGYECTTSEKTPRAGTWVNGTFELCPVGYFCEDWSDEPLECGVGMFCAVGSLAPEPCAEGKWCPNATTLEPLTCPAGSYCVAGSSVPLPCPASLYCPAGSAVGVFCDPGYFCPQGSAVQVECTAGYVCEVGTGTMTACPENFFCPPMCTQPVSCPAGSYCSEGMAAFPTQCGAGYYGQSPWCVQCPELMESANMATTCVCKAGLFFVFDNASNTDTSVLEDGQCLNTSLFCPPNFYCARDGVKRPCPPGSHSAAGMANLTGCVCDNGGVIMENECVNGTAAPADAPSAGGVSIAVVAGGVVAGVVVLGGGVAVAINAGWFGTTAAAKAPGVMVSGAVAPKLSLYGVEDTSTNTRFYLGIPAFLQEIRVDLQRKTV